ncbi:MAG: FecR domain-containing protein [Bacteroidales bacterium]|nr:FecR domain-containing protein [Bacteroidales bacterium]
MKEDIYHIASDYFKGSINNSDRLMLDKWLNESEENRLLFRELENIWNLTGTIVQRVDVDVETEWKRFADAKDNLPEEDRGKKNQKIIPSYILKIAAVVIPLIVISVVLLKNANEPDWITVETANNMQSIELPDGSKVWINKFSSLSYQPDFIDETRFVKFTGEAFFRCLGKSNTFCG